MNQASQFLINHGPWIVFGVVFLEQMGLPLPAMPWLLAAGALSANGKFNLFGGVAIAIIACLIADGFWFYLGRRRGNHILGLLCKISLEPDTCVRRTLNAFARYGMRGIMAAKFIPGMSTITPPLAGMTGVGAWRFLFFDGLGSLFYCGIYILLGYFFSSQITQIEAAISHVSGGTLSLLVAISVLYIAYKFWQRQRLLHKLRMARITVAELRQKLDSGETPVILDLRLRAELERDPSIISGAVHIDMKDFAQHSHGLPRDRDIVVYCSCPNEVSSAWMALKLHRKGFTRVRPLLGGIDAWREGNHPMGVWTTT